MNGRVGSSRKRNESALTRAVNAVFAFVRFAEFEIFFFLFFVIAFLIFKDLVSLLLLLSISLGVLRFVWLAFCDYLCDFQDFFGLHFEFDNFRMKIGRKRSYMCFNPNLDLSISKRNMVEIKRFSSSKPPCMNESSKFYRNQSLGPCTGPDEFHRVVLPTTPLPIPNPTRLTPDKEAS
ncbi:hypothetical protein L1049_025090 [Liquidambar formosana]|uniref:Uncharacterized protein n=1 Tax=Liquidambar formosana TaxID=63359 RepID=A0AAP0S2I1_LIQFO